MTIILEGGYFFIRDDSEPCTWMQMIFVINSGRHGNCQGKIWASQCICIVVDFGQHAFFKRSCILYYLYVPKLSITIYIPRILKCSIFPRILKK